MGMGNLNAKGNEKSLEQIYLSPTSKNCPQEPYLPDIATAASRMLNDPRSPTGEYTRTPIYRAEFGAIVTSTLENVHQGSSFALEAASAVKSMSFEEKYNGDFESENKVSNDVLIQNESGYETTKNRNTSSSQTASSQGSSSYESRGTFRRASSTQQKHSLATQPLKVLDQPIAGVEDATANTPSFSQHSARTIGLLTSLRSPGNASNKYQRIDND